MTCIYKSTFGTSSTPWPAYISIQEQCSMQFLESKRWPNLEGQGQWPIFSIPRERIPRCIFGANLVTSALIHYKLSRRQTKFPWILNQNGQNDLEGQGQLPPFSIPAESIRGCMFGANLVLLAQIYDELSRGLAKFPRILRQNGQNDLEGHGQWPPIPIPIESIPRCMFGANLVILAQICDELLCGQGKVKGRTDRKTDGQMDRRRQWQYPFSLKGQGVKMLGYVYSSMHT